MEDHCKRTVEVAMRWLDALQFMNQKQGWNFNMRVGIHTGPVVTGIFGKSRQSYEVVGETVTFAHFLESSSEPNKIHVSEAVYNRISSDYSCDSREDQRYKNQDVTTFFVQSKKSLPFVRQPKRSDSFSDASPINLTSHGSMYFGNSAAPNLLQRVGSWMNKLMQLNLPSMAQATSVEHKYRTDMFGRFADAEFQKSFIANTFQNNITFVVLRISHIS